MSTEQHAVKLTRNFERNLDDIERFLDENEATRAFDLLLDELADAVIPNLESFPKMGRPFLDRPALSVEATNRVEKLRTQLYGLGSSSDIRDVRLESLYCALCSHRDDDLSAIDPTPSTAFV